MQGQAARAESKASIGVRAKAEEKTRPRQRTAGKRRSPSRSASRKKARTPAKGVVVERLSGIASIDDVGGCGEVALKGSHDGLPLPRGPKASNIGRVGLQPGAVLRPRRRGTRGVDGNRRVGTTVLQVEAGHGSEEKDLSVEGGKGKKRSDDGVRRQESASDVEPRDLEQVVHAAE